MAAGAYVAFCGACARVVVVSNPAATLTDGVFDTVERFHESVLTTEEEDPAVLRLLEEKVVGRLGLVYV